MPTTDQMTNESGASARVHDNQHRQAEESASVRTQSAVVQFELPTPGLVFLHTGEWEGESQCTLCGVFEARFTIATPETAVRACVVCKNTLDLWEAFNDAAYRQEGPEEMICEEALRASEPWGVTYRLDYDTGKIVSVSEVWDLTDPWWFTMRERVEITEVRLHG